MQLIALFKSKELMHVLLFYRCDFQDGLLCDDLTQETDDSADWAVVRDASDDAAERPPFDHTSLSDKVM